MRKSTILVVEDEPHVLALVKGILRSTDAFEVMVADTADEALRIGLHYPQSIDLLLAKVVLNGGMLGTELASTLKKARPQMKVMLIDEKKRGEMAVLQRRCVEQGWQLLDQATIEYALLERIHAELDKLTATGR